MTISGEMNPSCNPYRTPLKNPILTLQVPTLACVSSLRITGHGFHKPGTPDDDAYSQAWQPFNHPILNPKP